MYIEPLWPKVYQLQNCGQGDATLVLKQRRVDPRMLQANKFDNIHGEVLDDPCSPKYLSQRIPASHLFQLSLVPPRFGLHSRNASLAYPLPASHKLRLPLSPNADFSLELVWRLCERRIPGPG